MVLKIGLITIGMIILIGGLMAGDLSYRGTNIPNVGNLPKFTTTITGAILIIVGGLALLLARL
jgi:hypothetical protein